MAERKTGPVKPPVIDLKPRQTTPVEAAETTAKPAAAPRRPRAEAQPAAETPEPTPPKPAEPKPAEPRPAEPKPAEPKPAESEPPRPTPPPRPLPRLAMPWSAISIAALGGALLGTALTYALVNLVPLPNAAPAPVDPTPRLDSQAGELAAFGQRLAAVEAQARRTQVSLDATIAQLDANATELRQAIAALPAPAAPVDLAPLTTSLRTLEDRVAAIGAGASTAEAATLAATMSELKSSLAALDEKLAALDQRSDTTTSSLAALQAEVTAAKAAIAAQNQSLAGADIAPAIRLPLVVSGLESAFANGRPYATELQSLTALLPDLAVPQALADNAATGLPRPDGVAQRFAAVTPDLLAGRTATPTGDLGEDAMQWVKALLALRPTGELEGDTPEAVASRLEAAVARRDFTAAAGLLRALPEPMRLAAGPVGGDIALLATAEGFIAGLRSQALASAEAAE